MRIQGRELKGPNVELIVIPRGNDEPIVLKAQAILDYDHFNKVAPEPEAPWVMKPGTGKERDFKDRNYLAAMKNRAKLQTNYMFIKSLEVTEGLEWETIDINRPDTWLNFESELQSAGFSQIERGVIVRGIMTANCLSEDKIEEARQRFIQSQAVQPLEGTSQPVG